MVLVGKLYMIMEVFTKVSLKLKIKMDMEGRFLKTENIMLVNLKMTKERDLDNLYLKVDVYKKEIGKMINF